MGAGVQELREESSGPSGLSVSLRGALPGAGEPLACHGQGKNQSEKQQVVRLKQPCDPGCLCHSGPDEHVRAGDPGGGDDSALVLPGRHHRQEQAAEEEPGGVYRLD